MPVDLMPNAEAEFIDWAEDEATMLAIHAGRVGTKLSRTLPAIRVTRIGDPSPHHWQDNAALAVECWGNNQDEADRLLRTMIAALPDIRGRRVPEGTIHTYEVTAGPYFVEDEQTGSVRYNVTVNFLITSSPNTGG
jgi:hypothetical protein